MFRNKRGSGNWVSIMLVAGLAAILFLYMSITSTLPERVYTAAQAETLAAAESRAINQEAITTNLYAVELDGEPSSEVPTGQDAVGQTNNQVVLPFRFDRWENTVRATLDARFEEQDGLGVTLYDLEFESVYRFTYPEDGARTQLEWIFPFPKNLETLNGVRFLVDGQEVPEADYTPERIRWFIPLRPGDEREVTIAYRADGINSFSYALNQGRRTEKLDVVIDVLGLIGSEIPGTMLRPTEVVANESGGQSFKWQYDDLVVNRDISLILPSQLSFAQRLAALQEDFALLARLAPFWVALFLLALAGLFRLESRRLPLPVLLLMGVGFALFYPLLTFISGVVGLTAGALLALVLVAGLLVRFIHLALADGQVSRRVAWLLFIFLGVLSLGLLLPSQGLMLSLGGFLLVGTFMVTYAQRPFPPLPSPDDFTPPPPSPAESPAVGTTGRLPEASPWDGPLGVAEEVVGVEELSEPEAGPPPVVLEPPVPVPHYGVYCPRCGRGQEADYAYCPGCGYDDRELKQCEACGHAQIVAEDAADVHCLNCGDLLA